MTERRSTCPKCSHLRHGRNQEVKCLKVFDDGGGFCHHCGYRTGRGGKQVKQYTIPSQELPPIIGEKALEFFKSRKITDSVLERNRIRSNGMEILFPYFYDGTLVNVKYRGYEKGFRQEKNAMKVFYGIDDVLGEDTIYIVEGEIDKLSCEVAGYANVLSVPDGAPSPDARTFATKFEYIDNCEHLFKNATRIIIAVDNDAAGKLLEAELIRRFDPEKCMTITWPEGCKDANDVLVKHGRQSLIECMETPVELPIKGVYTVDDYSEAVDLLYENGLQGGMGTGWHEMDTFYTVRPGEMTILTGIPSHGKSSWLNALTFNLAEDYELKFGVYTPENQPLQRFIASLATLSVGKPFRKGAHERMTKFELQKAKVWVGEHYFFIMPDDNELDIDNLLVKAKETVRRHGINGLILDPWNEITHIRPSGMTEHEYIDITLSKIRRFARTYQVHVWVVAHPTKMQKDKDGKFELPDAYKISGSAHWYNKGDCIVVVYRDPQDETKAVRVNVQKVRFREVGKPGDVYFNFDVMIGSYIAIGDTQRSFMNDHKETKYEG